MSIASELVDEVKTAVSNGVQDVEAFLGGAAIYAANNIKPALLKITADAFHGAEEAFIGDNSVDRYAHAMAAAGKAAAADGIEFVEADFNYAIEAMKQAQAARADKAAQTNVDPSASGTGTDNTGSVA